MLTDNGQTGVISGGRITGARIAARLHQPQGCHRRHCGRLECVLHHCFAPDHTQQPE